MYRISRTLRMSAGGQLIGVGQTNTLIIPATTGLSGATRADPAPMLVTAYDSSAVTVAFLSLVTWWHLDGVYTLRWRNRGGARSFFRRVYTTRLCECGFELFDASNGYAGYPPCHDSTNITFPKDVIEGTGRFYSWVNDEDILYNGAKYRHLAIRDVPPGAGGLRFYAMNMEHALGEANCEIINAHEVDIFGLKVEGNLPILWIHDCDHVNLWAYGGNTNALPRGTAWPSDFVQRYPWSVMRVERTPNLRMCNLIDHTGPGGAAAGRLGTSEGDGRCDFPPPKPYEWHPWQGGYHPRDQWDVIWEKDTAGVTHTASAQGVPAMYKRGV